MMAEGAVVHVGGGVCVCEEGVYILAFLFEEATAGGVGGVTRKGESDRVRQ